MTKILILISFKEGTKALTCRLEGRNLWLPKRSVAFRYISQRVTRAWEVIYTSTWKYGISNCLMTSLVTVICSHAVRSFTHRTTASCRIPTMASNLGFPKPDGTSRRHKHMTFFQFLQLDFKLRVAWYGALLSTIHSVAYLY